MSSEAGAGSTEAVVVEGLTYRYGERVALDEVGFSVEEGEIFGLLGPNGGGKTTLFSLLSSLRAVPAERIRVFGRDLGAAPAEVRRQIGVVFQAASLDPNLTVEENMMHQGHLYGLRGVPLASRSAELAGRLGFAERFGDRVAKLSGGLQRRVEIAKSLLHGPRLLLLDEPSTGLDPGIRRELWTLLEELRRDDGVTILLTTHFMEEGDRCDRVGLLDRGRLAAIGAPETLKKEVGGQVVRLATSRPREVVERVERRFGVEAQATGPVVQFELEGAHERVVELVEAISGSIHSITVAQPTLEDVFLRRTGHAFWESGRQGEA